METASLTENITHHTTERPAIQVLLNTKHGKEIRLAFKKGQVMKEHEAPFPIVVEVFEGRIDFGVNREVVPLKRGDLITLDGHVPHDLTALKDSIVRLSLHKSDTVKRVQKDNRL